jgi:hypothetical protein
MLGSLKRLFSGQGQGPDLGAVSDWARRRGHGFKRARDDNGFVIDGLLEGRPWRLEWGPPQRDYVSGRELRLRMELQLAAEVQLLVLSRPLMESLERQAFEQYTEGTQTQIGTSTPEEMRWLVMFPKVSLAAMPALKARFGAVASQVAAGTAWIEGPLANALEHAGQSVLHGDPPFVLMVLRRRAYLRLQFPEPDVQGIAVALDIFETAVARAIEVASSHVDSSATVWNTTAASAWQSLQPDDPSERKRR